MKDPTDFSTLDIFPLDPPPRRRGRPATGQAKTRAEIQQAYRRRKAGQGDSSHSPQASAAIDLLARISDLEASLESAKIDMAYWWYEHDRIKAERDGLRDDLRRIEEQRYEFAITINQQKVDISALKADLKRLRQRKQSPINVTGDEK